MKQQLFILCWLLVVQFSTKAQENPYTGGEGSGFATNTTLHTSCTMFYGGSSGGAASNFSPIVICTMFFGDSADGAASNYSPVIGCPSFFGGIGDGYDTGTFKFCQVLLPLKILNFSGIKEATQNILYWRVADVQDLRWFEVERSGDGLNFTKIGVVNAAGNTYQFADNQPLPNINYYRLRVIEQNNRIFYSGVVVLRSFKGSQFTVFPNPAKGHANVFYQSDEARRVTIRLCNIDGTVVLQQAIQLRKGSNYLILHFENIPSGVYMLMITETGDRLRLVVL